MVRSPNDWNQIKRLDLQRNFLLLIFKVATSDRGAATEPFSEEKHVYIHTSGRTWIQCVLCINNLHVHVRNLKLKLDGFAYFEVLKCSDI